MNLCLKKLKIIREIEVYLSRDGKFIPVNQGSSGELSLITTLAFMIMSIDERAVVLIDEPENSLHPKWQTEYVERVAAILYRYQPKIVIATHSPLIISSTEITTPRVNIFKGEKGVFKRVENNIYNVEEVYQDLFNVTTPESRFLSQFVVKKMNQLATGVINLQTYNDLINDLIESSYEDKQKEALRGLLNMGRQIINDQN